MDTQKYRNNGKLLILNSFSLITYKLVIRNKLLNN